MNRMLAARLPHTNETKVPHETNKFRHLLAVCRYHCMWAICWCMACVFLATGSLNALELGQRLAAVDQLTLIRPPAQGTPTAHTGEQATWHVLIGWQSWRHEQAPLIRALTAYQDPAISFTLVSPEDPRQLQQLAPQMPASFGIAHLEQTAYAVWLDRSQEHMPFILCDADRFVLWYGNLESLANALGSAKAGRLDRHHAVALAQALRNLASSVQSASLVEDVLQASRAVLTLDPGNPDAISKAAHIYRQRGDTKAYRQLFTTLSANEVASSQMITWAEQLLSDPDIRFRSPDIARHFALVLAQREPDSARRYALEARISAGLGDLRSAQQFAHQAYQRDPDFEAAFKHFSRLRELAEHHRRLPRQVLIQD